MQHLTFSCRFITYNIVQIFTSLYTHLVGSASWVCKFWIFYSKINWALRITLKKKKGFILWALISESLQLQHQVNCCGRILWVLQAWAHIQNQHGMADACGEGLFSLIRSRSGWRLVYGFLHCLQTARSTVFIFIFLHFSKPVSSYWFSLSLSDLMSVSGK